MGATEPLLAGPRKFGGRDVMLIVFCLPPVLLAVWLCCIQHNWQRGAGAVKHAAGFGPPVGPPFFFAGTAAGLIIVLIVTATGGVEVVRAALNQPALWIILCLPEIAWAGPLAIAWIALPLRRVHATRHRRSFAARSAF